MRGGVGGRSYKRLIKIMGKERACSAVSLLINSFIKNRTSTAGVRLRAYPEA